jgi:lipopolysaccharide transport system ATP-binding protein
MSDLAIRAQDVSKLYRIGQRRPHDTLRDLLSEGITAPLRRHGRSSSDDNQLWALRGVSFEVRHGEVIGIVGDNGAGKSTLLKILSRITEPTDGRVEIYGRLGSLLEVGTGFDPELSGRENVYLNGAILGMKRDEIRRRFDEIVEFAEIGKFIDTPVKRYSSGMYMRLAFAVAAHLESDILIVDEVLAVGDASFQRKCLGKIGSAAQTGRTVLFVSHSLLTVEDLCDRVIWLDHGRIFDQGEAKAVVSSYLQTTLSSQTEKVWSATSTAPGSEDVRLLRACVRPVGGTPTDVITVRTSLELQFEYRHMRPGRQLGLGFALFNEQGILLFTSGENFGPEDHALGIPTGDYRSVCHVPADLLNDGMHRVSIYVTKNEQTVVQHDDVLVFDVQDAVDLRGGWHGRWVGAVRPALEWETEIVNPG